MSAERNFDITNLQVQAIGAENQTYLGTAVLHDKTKPQDVFGVHDFVPGSGQAEDFVRAAHLALQDATTKALPGVERAELVDKRVFRTVPHKHHRADVRFLYLGEEHIVSAVHPTDPAQAQLNAVVKAHNTFYQ
ncbi:MAG TPA: hypothetical protein VG935_03470 [Patescibacteria group bacterium]|nr:hypothetical protein [Patescibacteria group bacterium]